MRQPGPLRAFYQRVRARRGHSVAIVAAASKLACLFWCLLTRDEDYAYAQPSLTKKKLRRLEITAGAPRYIPRAVRHLVDQHRDAPSRRELADQAELAYRDTVRDWHATQAKKGGRERDTGARIKQALEGQSRAADHKPLTSALRYVSHPRPPTRSHRSRHEQHPLDFHPSSDPAVWAASAHVLAIHAKHQRGEAMPSSGSSPARPCCCSSSHWP